MTLDYAALMQSLMLAPVKGETAKYAVLKVKNVSMNNTAVELSFNGAEEKATALLESGNDWQYVIFDLTEAGFTGDLTSLRIDWEKAASEAGNTMYLADIFFVAHKEQAEALTADAYVFPAQEQLEPETEAPTEEVTEAPTESADSSDTTASEETTAEAAVKSGCGASLAMTSMVMVAACAVVALRKKED